MCRVLRVTRAAFYKWLSRASSPTQQKQKQIVTEIKRIHSLPRHQDYGSPRIHRELVKQGTGCSVNTVAKLMKIEGIQARNKPKFRITVIGRLKRYHLWALQKVPVSFSG
jgi:putative transposase